MWLQNASAENKEFAQWLLEVGNGSSIDEDGQTIQLYNCINIIPSIGALIDKVYNNTNNGTPHDD
jgi:hypothetical protein